MNAANGWWRAYDWHYLMSYGTQRVQYGTQWVTDRGSTLVLGLRTYKYGVLQYED
jgi:hypothetical protein